MKSQQDAGFEYDEEQKRWLQDIADHIGGSLEINSDEFEYPPFSRNGGLGKVQSLFGDKLDSLIKEINQVLIR